ncbi:MAG: Ldh family oxidoreductase [Betaproteobacteria bacterium]
MDAPRFSAAALQDFAIALLTRAGLAETLARDVAETLLEGDLLGHDTHGLALLAAYLAEIDRGGMTREGNYEVLNARSSVANWDGKRLPGPWLVRRAIDAAIAMAREHGSGTITIRRSHHIACLAAYLQRATDHGMVIQLICSDPNSASVAPFGGTQAVFTPNPMAFGFPTEGDPVWIDISASLTTNGMTGRLLRQKEQLAHPWLLDNNGTPSRDPAVLFTKPPGTILPLGGTEAGHKGYGLALTVEALTGGLAGFGRADAREGWGATVFVQVLDPEAFGGKRAFERQMQSIADSCRKNEPRPDMAAVRLPGDAGLARRREQLTLGVRLNPEIMPALSAWAEKFGVALPQPIGNQT